MAFGLLTFLVNLSALELTSVLVGTGALFCIVWDRGFSWGKKKGAGKHGKF